MSSFDKDTCLQCGETRASVKANGYICGILGGGEYNELLYDFPTHRWADWSDKDLHGHGIKSDSFHKYRREDIQNLPYAECEDTVRGHSIIKNATQDDIEMGFKEGMCAWCFQQVSEEGEL